MWTPSNTPMPGRPHSPPQTATRSLHALLHNYATKSPLVTMGSGCPYSPQNCPFSCGDLCLHLLASSLDPATHYPKRHPGPISRFSTIHWTNRHTHTLTHTQTDGIDDIAYMQVLVYAVLIIVTQLIMKKKIVKTI